jgi:hypothetical protein
MVPCFFPCSVSFPVFGSPFAALPVARELRILQKFAASCRLRLLICFVAFVCTGHLHSLSAPKSRDGIKPSRMTSLLSIWTCAADCGPSRQNHLMVNCSTSFPRSHFLSFESALSKSQPCFGLC